LTELGRAEAIDALVRPWLKEVAELRQLMAPDENGELHPFGLPEPGDGPAKVYQALLKARGSLDRVEVLLAQAMALRSGAEARARELTENADDELDARVDARARRAREFESARERFAAASLDVLEKRREARSAQKLADMAASAEARIRLAYRGLESLRSDLQTALRHVSWENSLDR